MDLHSSSIMCSRHINYHWMLFGFHSERCDAGVMPLRAGHALLMFIAKTLWRHRPRRSTAPIAWWLTCALRSNEGTRRKMLGWSILCWNGDVGMRHRGSSHAIWGRRHGTYLGAVRGGFWRWRSWWKSVWRQRRMVYMNNRSIAWYWHMMRQWSRPGSRWVHATIGWTSPRALWMSVIDRCHSNRPCRYLDRSETLTFSPLGSSILKPYLQLQSNTLKNWTVQKARSMHW